jgi:C-terminal processing protease CtpA/Prc
MLCYRHRKSKGRRRQDDDGYQPGGGPRALLVNAFSSSTSIRKAI